MLDQLQVARRMREDLTTSMHSLESRSRFRPACFCVYEVKPPYFITAICNESLSKFGTSNKLNTAHSKCSWMRGCWKNLTAPRSLHSKRYQSPIATGPFLSTNRKCVLAASPSQLLENDLDHLHILFLKQSLCSRTPNNLRLDKRSCGITLTPSRELSRTTSTNSFGVMSRNCHDRHQHALENAFLWHHLQKLS